MEVTKAQVAAAANFLVQARDYTAQVRQVAEVISEWEDRHVFFTGGRAVLNALVNLGLQYPDKLARLYEIVEEKRKAVPALRRNEYQREFMAQSRERIGKALEIEALVEGRRLTTQEKLARGQRIKAEWSKRKEELLASKGDLGWAERNAVKQQFWDQVDKELATMLKEARQIAETPGHRVRRVVKVTPKPPANRQLYDALQDKRKARK